MTRKEFSHLSLNEKARIILQQSYYLSTIEYSSFKVNLYSLSDFFIEVKLMAITSDVESIRIIGSEDVEKFVGDVVLPYHP
ncbi:MAG: hypothetical protein DI538_10150 [Azospira oryzae]|jgi:hypothetical protein|nr:MAG: hypothetical protein DI538_10150 [Azospira oryzae]